MPGQRLLPLPFVGKGAGGEGVKKQEKSYIVATRILFPEQAAMNQLPVTGEFKA
jgi:hypothetical protein